MAASQPRLGMHHVTVVPTNFVPEGDESDAPRAERALEEATS